MPSSAAQTMIVLWAVMKKNSPKRSNPTPKNGWLLIRSGLTAFQVVLLVVGYALLELALVVLAVPILVAEALLLVSLAWPAAEASPLSAGRDASDEAAQPTSAGRKTSAEVAQATSAGRK